MINVSEGWSVSWGRVFSNSRELARHVEDQQTDRSHDKTFLLCLLFEAPISPALVRISTLFFPSRPDYVQQAAQNGKRKQ